MSPRNGNNDQDVSDPRSDALRLSYGALTGCTAEQLNMFRVLIYEIEGLRERLEALEHIKTSYLKGDM